MMNELRRVSLDLRETLLNIDIEIKFTKIKELMVEKIDKLSELKTGNDLLDILKYFNIYENFYKKLSQQEQTEFKAGFDYIETEFADLIKSESDNQTKWNGVKEMVKIEIEKIKKTLNKINNSKGSVSKNVNRIL